MKKVRPTPHHTEVVAFEKKNINILWLSSIVLVMYFSIKSLYVPWTFFKSGYFGFYDLGLISNFLSNTAKGIPFYVNEYAFSHLSIHWTPTLFLIAPFFSLFKSQFFFIFISNTICFLGLIYFIFFLLQQINIKFQNSIQKLILALFFIIIFYSNKYINANFLAGHFEVIGIPLILATLTSILKNKPFYYSFLPFILSLGIRQDVGFFLFFQLLSLLFIPKYVISLNKNSKKLILLYMVSCLFYMFFSIKFMLPLMGAKEGLRATDFWSQWGHSWGEIAKNAFSHPFIVIQTILNTGFTNFNEAFFYLGLFNPVQWLFVQAPGTLFYMANTMDKNHLFWYNSAFLLPGVYVSTYVGLIIVAQFLTNRKLNYLFYALMSPLLATVILKSSRAIGTDFYKPKSENALADFQQVLSIVLAKCQTKPVSFSSDVVNFVYLDNRTKNYLLEHYLMSQIIIFKKLSPKNFSSEMDFTKYTKLTSTNIPENKNLSLLYKDELFTVYSNERKINCGQADKNRPIQFKTP